MKYRLIGDGDVFNIKKTILNNRGVEDITTFLNPQPENVHSPFLMDKMQSAIKCLEYHIKNKSKIHIIAD